MRSTHNRRVDLWRNARVYCICSTCTMSSYRKFTFAISSPDEILVSLSGRTLASIFNQPVLSKITITDPSQFCQIFPFRNVMLRPRLTLSPPQSLISPFPPLPNLSPPTPGLSPAPPFPSLSIHVVYK